LEQLALCGVAALRVDGAVSCSLAQCQLVLAQKCGVEIRTKHGAKTTAFRLLRFQRAV
jgi:hypothetical protein